MLDMSQVLRNMEVMGIWNLSIGLTGKRKWFFCPLEACSVPSVILSLPSTPEQVQLRRQLCILSCLTIRIFDLFLESAALKYWDPCWWPHFLRNPTAFILQASRSSSNGCSDPWFWEIPLYVRFQCLRSSSLLVCFLLDHNQERSL